MLDVGSLQFWSLVFVTNAGLLMLFDLLYYRVQEASL
jgi:hypothetical protein